jgi:hypothetical protein
MSDPVVKKMLDSIHLVTTYATKFMEQEQTHPSSNKNVYWVIFDKQYNPYWLVSYEQEFDKEPFYDIYRVNKERLGLDSKDKIAELELQVKNNSSILHHIEILKPAYANQKIGSALIDLFEYIAFTNGAKTAKGMSSALNEDIINQKNLNQFYAYKKYKVKKQKSINVYRLSKTFNPHSIKEYAKNFITVKKNNVIFKFQIPNYYKPIIAYELTKQKTKLSSHKITNQYIEKEQ